MMLSRRQTPHTPDSPRIELPHGKGPVLSLVAWAFICVALATCELSGGFAGESTSEPHAPIVFRRVGIGSGVDFQFQSGSHGEHHLPEIMGGGVAVLDVDADGRLDLYFCNGGPIGSREPRGYGYDGTCRLYRNLGGWKFLDITDRCGAPGPRCAMGVASGDYDGDGRVDLFVTGYREQKLYRNLGAGRFEDRTEAAGLSSRLWTTSAAFADLDSDGDLDLYVAAYVEYDPANAPFCAAPDGQRDFCGPQDFEAQPGRLYRNNGDGTFTNLPGYAGTSRRNERGLGILIADLTGDGIPDIYVANDGGPGWLLANHGDLQFKEIGQQAGVARDAAGVNPAGMGVALGDLDGDGRSDLAVTNFLGRSTIAFRMVTTGPETLYQDASAALGIAAATRPVLGFGIAIQDFDGDGRLDLVQTNGHVLDRARLGIPLAMKPTLLQGRGNRLADVSHLGGAWFGQAIVGRGLAVGDLDGDGRPDLVACAQGAPAALLKNASHGGHVLAVQLHDRHGQPAVGAHLRANVSGRVLVRDQVGGGSYLSGSDPVLYFGLGSAQRIDRLDVQWPRGSVETWNNLAAGRLHRLDAGKEASSSPLETLSP